MKKTEVKEKASKKSASSTQVEQQGLLDLVSVMTKIAERLDGLEKKVEQVIRQTSAGSAGMMQGEREQSPDHHYFGQNQGSQQNSHRHERIMYQAVCSDCRKDCEVPFKPTGERPVYCKVCFTKRKDVGQREKTAIEQRMQLHQHNPVKVMPKGAINAAISGAVSASAHASSKTRSNKAGKKART